MKYEQTPSPLSEGPPGLFDEEEDIFIKQEPGEQCSHSSIIGILGKAWELIEWGESDCLH